MRRRPRQECGGGLRRSCGGSQGCVVPGEGPEEAAVRLKDHGAGDGGLCDWYNRSPDRRPPTRLPSGVLLQRVRLEAAAEDEVQLTQGSTRLALAAAAVV